jgi:hypothetical protein
LLLSGIETQADTFRPFNASNPTNPYGLDDLDGFNLGDYGYCRWGVLQSDDYVSVGEADLTFTHLTRGPFTFADNPDLFVSTSLTTLTDANLLQFSTGTWTPPSGLGHGSVSFSALPDKTYSLFRKLHFRDYLQAKFFSVPLPKDAKKVIILIHGWNPDSKSYHYDDEFDALYEAIKAEVSGTEWHLVLYHWEEDADTGDRKVDVVPPPFLVAPHPTDASEAATIAHMHGQHLGELLSTFPQLEKVHFIAHSAGTWTARAATRHLLQRTTKKVQITLLDPFIPGEITGHTTPFSRVNIDGIPALATGQSGQLAYLENIYAIDVDGANGWPASTDNVYFATSAFFSWPDGKGWNQRVDWSPGETPVYAQAAFYDSHSGPIGFYADTVLKFGRKKQSPAGLGNNDLKLDLVGWKRSMFYQEASVPVTLPAPSSLTATAISSSQINLTWRDTPSESGFKIERRLGSSGEWSQIGTRSADVTSYSDTGRAAGTAYSYRVRAYNAAGDSDYSPVASATTQPAAGGSYSLTIQAIDLDTGNPLAAEVYTWTDGSTGLESKLTPFARSFPAGTEAKLACLTMVAGKQFKYLQAGDAIRDFPTWSVAMTSDQTVVVAYGSAATLGKVLKSLTIEGPSSADERTSEQYRARATYTDGTSAYVSAEWDDNSSYADISANGLLDTDAVSSNREIEVEATFTAGGVPARDTKIVTIRNTDEALTHTLELNSTTGGSVGYSPKGISYADGTVVSLHGNADDGYVFSHWSGDVADTDTDDDITVRMNRNRSVTAHFAVDTRIGSLRVDLSPSQAAAEGAQWKYDLFTNWRDSGNTQDGISPRVNRSILFKDLPGWVTPGSIKASIIGGQTTVVNATYREILGSVQVTIEPHEAGLAGGRWQLDDGNWFESGAALPDVATGVHTMKFSAAAGWTAPSPRTIAVQRGVAAVVTASYGPPLGLPVITTITPSSGGLDGGYVVTIDGVNFGPASTVTFGGIQATAVTVERSTRITATVPAGVRYGTVAVTVTSEGQSGTKPSGFSYSVPLAQNMTLLSQIGGTVGAVAASGGMVYFGEGSSLVSADYSNPNSPVVRGRLPLPGLVRDIRIVGNHALVANDAFGLQVVDVSDPVSLRLVGYYDTPGTAQRLGTAGSVAYLADGTGGLQVIDFSDLTNPRRVGGFSAANASDVGVTTIGSRVIVCLASQNPNGILVLDAGDVANLHLITTLEGGISHASLALSGTTLVCRGLLSAPNSIVARIYDITDPANAKKTHEGTFFVQSDVAAVGAGLLYSGASAIEIYDLNIAPNPSRKSATTMPGTTRGMALSGTTLFIAKGSGGLVALDVSAPVSPVIRSTLNSTFVPTDIAVSDGKIYAAIGGGLTVIDAADPRHPQRLGTASSEFGAGKIVETGKNVYSTASLRRLTSFSVADASAPAQISAVQTSGISYAMGLVNGLIVTGGQIQSNDRAFLALYAPSDFQAGTPVSKLELTTGWGQVTAVAVAGNTVFAFLSERGFLCIDCSNPQSPQIVGSLLSQGNVQNAATSADGRYLYAASVAKGLLVYDCSSPSQPLPVGSYVRSGQSKGQAVAVGAGLVFYADINGLNVLDFTNPSNPRLVAWFDTPGTPTAVKADAGIIYVADGDGGISIIGLADLSQPLIEITGPTRNATFETSSPALRLTGTASDSGGIVRVSWHSNRGSGGEAKGTADWSIDGIQLSAGPNVITVAAEDSSGNVVEDTLTVIATLPDTTPPVVTITGPKPDDEFVVETDVLTLSGSVADNQSVVSVTWSSSAGGSGPATLTGQSWTVADVPLVAGPNVIQVTATDANGNSASDTAVIFLVPPDTAAPLVTIDFPTANAVLETQTAELNLSGLASDDQGVVRVEWSDGRGGQGVAAGAFPWSVNGLALLPGLNVIEVTAFDAAGNAASDSLAVTYLPPPLELQVMGVVDGIFRFQVSGPAGSTIAIQRSGDFNQWEPLGTRTLPPEGTTTVEDDAPLVRQRFYRVLPQGQ